MATAALDPIAQLLQSTLDPRQNKQGMLALLILPSLTCRNCVGLFVFAGMLTVRSGATDITGREKPEFLFTPSSDCRL